MTKVESVTPTHEFLRIAHQVTPFKKGSKKQKIVRALIITSVAAVLALKVRLLFLMDPIVAMYGVLTSFTVFIVFLIAYTKYKDPSAPPTTNVGRYADADYFVTVIIPAKNDPIIIREAVDAYLNSSFKKTEIILVNDASTDETGSVMDSIQKEHPDKVRVIHLPKNLGKRKAIYEGVQQGNPKGNILVFADSDSVVHEKSLEKLVHVFDDPKVGAVTGRARAKNVEDNILTRIQDTWYDGQFSIIKGMESSFNSVTCCSGSLSAYRKEAVMPCLEAWVNDKFLGAEFRPGDDRHLTSYVIGGVKHYIDSRAKPWKACYCESALVNTEAPNTFKKLIRQQIRWKKSWFRIFCFTAPFFYKNRHPLSVAFYYSQMLLSLITPLVFLRAMIILPIQGNFMNALVYISGILFIGLVYGLEFRLRHPHLGHRWMHRILMSLLSTFVLSFLLYYSLLTIRKSSWLTR